MAELPIINEFRKYINADIAKRLLIRSFGALFFAGMFNIIKNDVGFDVLQFVSSVNPILYITMLIGFVILITFISRITSLDFDYYILGISAVSYCSLIACKKRDFYVSLGLLIVITSAFHIIIRFGKLNIHKVLNTKKAAITSAVTAAVFFMVFVGGVTTFRYLNYSSSTYDFGIFSQMFYYMKNTLIPNTTCERSILLSHFSIHMSPMFYLLLPGYFLFPCPEYLQIMQATVVASSVIPLYLLSRKNQLSYLVTGLICIAFSLHPALTGGCLYDIHENMFLTPLILWLFYFLDRACWRGVYLFSALTMLVKEDAVIYVACIALYIIFTNKKKLHGFVIFVISAFYFAVAVSWLKYMGYGIMSDRFNNFISDRDGGLLNIIKTILFNPAYVLTEIFKQEKTIYIAIMLIPVAFIPLLNKRFSQYILIIPFVVINLISNYPYMHSIYFQYHFGTLALFYYLIVINLKTMASCIKKYALPLMTAASLIFFITNVGCYADNIETYIDKRAELNQLNEALEKIPEDASVQATGYLVPKLSSRKELYDIQYVTEQKDTLITDYIVIDLRPGAEDKAMEYLTGFLDRGYKMVEYNDEILAILKDPNSTL